MKTIFHLVITLGLGCAALAACGGVEDPVGATEGSALSDTPDYEELPTFGELPSESPAFGEGEEGGLFPAHGGGTESAISVQTCNRRHRNCVRSAEAAYDSCSRNGDPTGSCSVQYHEDTSACEIDRRDCVNRAQNQN